MMSPAIVLALVLPQQTPSLVYTAPSVEAPVDAHTISPWKPGDRPYLGVDEANLRATPAPDGTVVTTLRLGTQVEVVETVGARQRIGGRTDSWVKIRTVEGEPKEGHVFGGVLTPLVLKGDLDGDGAEERVGVVYSPEYRPRVRVFEPALKGKWVVTTQDIEPVAKPVLGGTLTLVDVPEEKGQPKLFAVKDCAKTCTVTVLEYRAQKGKLGSVLVVSRSEVAASGAVAVTRAKNVVNVGISSSRLIRGRWVPSVCALCGNGEVNSVKWSKGAELVMLHFESEARGPNEDAPCTISGKVTAGPYKGKDVVSCVVGTGGKDGPATVDVSRFIKDGKKSLVYLPSASDRAYANDIQSKLSAKKFSITSDPRALLSGVFTGDNLFKDERGRFADPQNYEARLGATTEVPLFDHEVLGTVSGNAAGEASIVVDIPEGGSAYYRYWPIKDYGQSLQWRASAASQERVEYTAQHANGCSGGESYSDTSIAPVTPDQLEPYGIVEPGPFDTFRMKGKLREERINQLAEEFQVDAQTLSTTPPVYFTDSFGRWLELLPSTLRVPCMAEPIVYFYAPTQIAVTYSVDPRVTIPVALPAHHRNRWTVTAQPDGTFLDGEGRSHSWLFWEGSSSALAHPGTGDVVAREDLRGYFVDILPKLGLRGREIADFIDAWVPRLQRTPFVLIHFHDPAVIDAMAPVRITPGPDAFVRIMMDALPLGERVDVEKSPLPAPPARGAFTVVEWGGLVR